MKNVALLPATQKSVTFLLVTAAYLCVDHELQLILSHFLYHRHRTTSSTHQNSKVSDGIHILTKAGEAASLVLSFVKTV